MAILNSVNLIYDLEEIHAVVLSGLDAIAAAEGKPVSEDES